MVNSKGFHEILILGIKHKQLIWYKCHVVHVRLHEEIAGVDLTSQNIFSHKT
jgi:hypothetical protein